MSKKELKLEKRVLNYIGFENPETVDEIQIEIMGLKQAIKEAELRIAKLNLGYVIATAEIAQKNYEAAKEEEEEKEEEAEEAEDKVAPKAEEQVKE